MRWSVAETARIRIKKPQKDRRTPYSPKNNASSAGVGDFPVVARPPAVRPKAQAHPAPKSGAAGVWRKRVDILFFDLWGFQQANPARGCGVTPAGRSSVPPGPQHTTHSLQAPNIATKHPTKSEKPPHPRFSTTSYKDTPPFLRPIQTAAFAACVSVVPAQPGVFVPAGSVCPCVRPPGRLPAFTWFPL